MMLPLPEGRGEGKRASENEDRGTFAIGSGIWDFPESWSLDLPQAGVNYIGEPALAQIGFRFYLRRFDAGTSGLDA